MTAPGRIPRKHTLVDHWNDISTWWHDIHYWDSYYGPKDTDKQTILMLAYERWLNNRELLTIEDNYQWQTQPYPGQKRHGAIGP